MASRLDSRDPAGLAMDKENPNGDHRCGLLVPLTKSGVFGVAFLTHSHIKLPKSTGSLKL